MSQRAIRWARPALRITAGLLLAAALPLWAHGVAADDALVVGSGHGARPALFAYLGAKHMLSGLDHGLFLLGMVALLRRWRDVACYATLFALGHSVTLLAGVLAQWQVNEHAVDAIIGLSVVYKGADNLQAWRILLGWRPPPRSTVLLFGLAHGLGLATKLQALTLSTDGLLVNLLAFNAGVEAGQLLALGLIVLVLAALRAWFDGRRSAPALATRTPLAAAQPAGRTTTQAASGLASRWLNLGLVTAGLVLALGQFSAWALQR